jgi:hypothetical protein
MDMYESLYSSSCALNEQIARQLFEVLPEQGPVVVIVDREGHLWPSDTERFSQLNVGESLLKKVCANIDDGAEPVVTQVGDSSVVAAELATDHTKCGYVVVVLQQYGPESTLANIDLVEMVLSQINLIAKLIEKNSRLYELQMRQWSVYGQVEAPIN